MLPNSKFCKSLDKSQKYTYAPFLSDKQDLSTELDYDDDDDDDYDYEDYSDYDDEDDDDEYLHHGDTDHEYPDGGAQPNLRERLKSGFTRPDFSTKFKRLVSEFAENQIDPIDIFYNHSQTTQHETIDEVIYYLDFEQSYKQDIAFLCSLKGRARLKSGALGKEKNIRIQSYLIRALGNTQDREIIQELVPYGIWQNSYSKYGSYFSYVEVPFDVATEILRKIVESSRAKVVFN